MRCVMTGRAAGPQLSLLDWPIRSSPEQPKRAPRSSQTAKHRNQSAMPIVKWAGGKLRLLSGLLARIPDRHGCYYEPMAGGAALFFALAPEHAVLADSNADLMAMYAAVRAEPEELISLLQQMRTQHSAAPEEHYYTTRAAWNAGLPGSAVERSAAFIYLNKTCFNGLWRVNRAGAFNVPMGRYTDPPICAPEALRAASVALRRAELRSEDYRASVADAQRGDFVYFDPPYDPVASTANFTSYTADEFGPSEQAELADTARELAARVVYVMLSNADTPRVRELYGEFRIDAVKCRRAINSNTAKRGSVSEVIITAGYTPRQETR